MGSFTRYIGIDYSGAETPSTSLKGLRIYLAVGGAPPVEMLPPSPREYWTGAVLQDGRWGIWLRMVTW